MLIESGERWRWPDEPPPDRWSGGSLRCLLPWAHVLLLSTASLAVPGWLGVLLAFMALGFALEVAYREVRKQRRSRGQPGRPPRRANMPPASG